MSNIDLAKQLYEIADLLELSKVKWKPQAFRRAAKTIIGLREDVKKIYKKGGIKALEKIPGVGSGIADKIVQYIKKGKITAYRELRKKLPDRLTEVAKIPGLGVRRAKILYQKLKIKNVEDLKKSVKLHKISKLEGFGAKSEKNIADALGVYKQQARRRPLKEMLTLGNKIKRRLEKFGGERVDVGGSIRRKRETIRDIDMLAIGSKKLIDYFCKMKEVKKVLAKGSTKASILLINNVEVDLRVVPRKSYGAALLYFTGNKEYNIRMRKLAMKKGYKLSEYGLFDRKTGKFIAGKTEQEVFKKLGMKFVKPEKRW